MNNWVKYIVRHNMTIRQVLTIINDLGENHCVLFLTDETGKLLGTVTDGDIRRGLIANAQLEQPVESICNRNFYKVYNGDLNPAYLKECSAEGITILPNLKDDGTIIDILDLKTLKGILPLHAIIMAGGKGERLLPLTKNTPKPMLKVGDKPIIEHNIDQLKTYGVQNFHISINYLGNIISDYFKSGVDKGIQIEYITESVPMGTLGSVSLLEKYHKDELLIMNSDLLTNIDFADFYNEFKAQEADMAVATIPYHVDLPYAIMELNGAFVTAFKEKPRYTYFANAGIYIIKSDLVKMIPKNSFYNATDLMQLVIENKKKLINYPILGYWLDIGKPEDFVRAQKDIQHLHL